VTSDQSVNPSLGAEEAIGIAAWTMKVAERIRLLPADHLVHFDREAPPLGPPQVQRASSRPSPRVRSPAPAWISAMASRSSCSPAKQAANSSTSRVRRRCSRLSLELGPHLGEVVPGSLRYELEESLAVAETRLQRIELLDVGFARP